MPKEIYQILGQNSPAESAEEILYTVPKNRTAIVRVSVFAPAAGASVHIASVPDGGSAAAPTTVIENYILNGYTLTASEAYCGDELKGITLGEFDQIRVEADGTGAIFHAYGVELEP